jgi:hypothetical protein
MDGKSTSRTKARLLVLGVFLIGLVAGALAMNLYNQRTYARPGGRDHNGRPAGNIMKKMTDRLGLNSDQQNQVRAILDDTFDQYRQIREKADPAIGIVRQKSRERIRTVLKPDQLPKFEEMVVEMDRKREEYKEKEKK